MDRDTPPPIEALLASEFPERLVSLSSGARVAWREAGDPRSSLAVVLLHGISSGAASWLGVARALHARVRVLAWDAPGYGGSTPLRRPVPVDDDYSLVLEQSLHALGVRHCLLVGHSLGALTAAGFARRAPGVVQRLALISPAGGYGAPDRAEQRDRVRRSRLAALAEKGIAGLAADIDRRLVSPAAPESVRRQVRWSTARLTPQGYAQAVEFLCAGDLGRSVGALAMPVDVWVGEHDIVTPPDACAAWASRLQGRCVTLAAAGHASPVEQPDAVADGLAHLLS